MALKKEKKDKKSALEKKQLKLERSKSKKDRKEKIKAEKKTKEKFWVSLKKELKLVKWPTFKDILKYTIATVILCVILILFFELLNIGMAYIKGLFN